jgi:hypothetical protein
MNALIQQAAKVFATLDDHDFILSGFSGFYRRRQAGRTTTYYSDVNFLFVHINNSVQ